MLRKVFCSHVYTPADNEALLTGSLGYEQFASAVTKAFLLDQSPDSRLLIDKLFCAFDTKQDQRIDWKQFSCGIGFLCRGDPEERLKAAYAVISGVKASGHFRADQEDLGNFLTAVSGCPATWIKGFVHTLMVEADTDKRGSVTIQQLLKWRGAAQVQILLLTHCTHPRYETCYSHKQISVHRANLWAINFVRKSTKFIGS